MDGTRYRTFPPVPANFSAIWSAVKVLPVPQGRISLPRSLDSKPSITLSRAVIWSGRGSNRSVLITRFSGFQISGHEMLRCLRSSNPNNCVRVASELNVVSALDAILLVVETKIRCSNSNRNAALMNFDASA